LTAASTPSIFDVTSVSITRADAPFHRKLTLRLFCFEEGVYWILSNGMIPAPITTITIMIRMTE